MTTPRRRVTIPEARALAATPRVVILWRPDPNVPGYPPRGSVARYLSQNYALD